MLVHFPSALYPFSLVMEILSITSGNSIFAMTAFYSLLGGVGMSVVALIYGAIDFLQIDTRSPAWKIAGTHALLNVTWWIVFASLLFYQVKHPDTPVAWVYVSIMGIATAGLLVSNYLGAELVIRYKIGITSGERD